MSNFVLNTYQFETLPGADVDQFIRNSERIDHYLLGLEGFAYRSLSRLANGDWLDCVFWRNATAAAQAQNMMSLELFMDFVADIDKNSVQMTQSEIVSQVYPEMEAA
jgi:hypothetical protein